MLADLGKEQVMSIPAALKINLDAGMDLSECTGVGLGQPSIVISRRFYAKTP
jgi:hypothetical protein